MKISELPAEIREKALEYQRNETTICFDKDTDILERAFNWERTNEKSGFWMRWHEKETKSDPIVESVISQFKQRSKVGIKKYGTTLHENNFDDFYEHLKQELMDAILYLEKLKTKKP